MPKVNVGDVVRVDWQDHYSNGGAWQNLSEVRKQDLREIVCSSVGLIINENDNQILLAQNWHPMHEENDWKVADFMVVIKACIRKLTVLKKKEFKI